MRVVLMSDSHGRDLNVEFALKQAGSFDVFVHMGDVGAGYKLMRDKIMAQCIMVRGNTDIGIDLPDSKIFELGNHKALAVHGHRQEVSFGTESLEYLAKQYGCDLVFFGHTHIPFMKEKDGILFLNPGSISQPRQTGYKKTYMILDIDDKTDEVTYKLHEFNY